MSSITSINLKILLSLMMLSVVYCPTVNAQDDIDTLVELSLEELMNVLVVSTSRKSEEIRDAPGIVQVITKDEIEGYGYTQLYDIINRATNAFILNTYFISKSAVTLRGGRTSSHYNNHVLVMINGRPVRETGVSGLDSPLFTSFPVSIIERIEIVRGAGSVLYGSNAFQGSINIITKKGGNEVFARAGGGNQSNAYFEGSVSGEVKGFDMIGSVFSNRLEGDNINGFDEAGAPFSFENKENATGALFSINKERFTSTAYLTHTSHGQLGAIPFVSFPTNPPIVDTLDTPGGYVFDSRELICTRAGADIGYNLPFSDKLNAQFNASISTMNLGYNFLYGGVATHDATDYLIEAILFYTPNDKLNLVGGINTNILTGEGLALNIGYNENWYAAYVQGDYALLPSLKILGGLQINSPTRDIVETVPRAGIVFHLSESFGIKALYGRAFRSPMPFEQSVNSPPILVGNPDIEPELNENVDFQTSYENKNVRIAATGYMYRNTELIARTTPTDNSPPTYTNRGQILGYGFEFESTVKLKSFGFNGSFSYQTNELEDRIGANNSDTTITDFTLMPNIFAKVGAFYNYKSLVGLGVFYNGIIGMREWDDAAKLNPFSENINLVSLNFYVDILKLTNSFSNQSLRFEVYVDNLLDEDGWYPEFVRRNINSVPGYQRRLFRMGLSYKF